MKIAAIIPARGGSKRLEKKNIHPIWGEPMLFWAIQACKQSKYDIDVWVSTEDEEIASVAKQCGAKVIKRDEALAGDKIYKQAVVRSAAHIIKKEANPDIYISLQPNSPQIKAGYLDEAIDTLLEFNRDEIFSVDGNLMQNAAFRIFRGDYVFQEDLSTNCGGFMCHLEDIHTLEELKKLEKLWGDPS
jgi:CMP-N,N'-diacetyllegionaminic acid synthase